MKLGLWTRICYALFGTPEYIDTYQKENNIHIRGNNISIKNGKIFIDGKAYHQDSEKCILVEKVVIEGNVESLEVDQGNVDVYGSSGKTTSSQGNITVRKNVNGNIKSDMGDVTVDGWVTGNVEVNMGNSTIRGKNKKID